MPAAAAHDDPLHEDQALGDTHWYTDEHRWCDWPRCGPRELPEGETGITVYLNCTNKILRLLHAKAHELPLNQTRIGAEVVEITFLEAEGRSAPKHRDALRWQPTLPAPNLAQPKDSLIEACTNSARD